MRFLSALNGRQRLRRPLLAAALVLAQIGIVVAVTGLPPNGPDRRRHTVTEQAASRPTAEPATTTSLSTTTTATTTTTLAPATTTSTSPPPSSTAPRPRRPAAPPAASVQAPPSGGITAYVGLGTWVDVFDFTPAHSKGNPTVRPADVDAMAAAGVQTLYLQAARPEDPLAPDDLVLPDMLAEFLVRAHANNMQVVAWYLPHLTNVDDDMRHLAAMLNFSVDGHRFDSVALDIEWRAGVADHDTRSDRLVDLSQRLRAAAGDRSLGAIVMPPVVTDVLNPNFWPGYPWDRLAPLYNVWLPMSYWTNRAGDSPYRNAHRYTADNINLLRQHVGSGAAVHVIGGIGNAATGDDYRGFMQAAGETGVVGHSIYDWATTAPGAYPILRGPR